MNARYTTKILTVALIMLQSSYCLSLAHAQQTSEQYIPIGMSPGISGSISYIGSITGRDSAAGSITVLTDEGSKTVKVTPATRIWLDRSKNRKSNIEADFEALESGSRVEVLPAHADRDSAEWIKVESM